MLFLLFKLGKDTYALDAGQIVEILPLVGIKEVPQSPPGVAGMMLYRGEPVPVIDLTALALGHPASAQLSTRIIVVNYPDERGEAHTLGLIAEYATETVRLESADFVASGISLDTAPYLGPVAATPRGLIQRLNIDRLVPTSVRELLFRQAAVN